MATQVTFDAHSSFHSEVTRGCIGAACGGALAGISLTVLGSTGAGANLLLPLSIFGMATASGFVGSTLRQRILRLAGSTIAAIVPALVIYYLRSPYPVFTYLLAGVGLGFVLSIDDKTSTRRFAAAVLGIPAVILGGFVLSRIYGFASAEQVAPLPIVTTVSAAIGGFVSMAIFGLRRITVTKDPVARAYGNAESILRGELLKHASQAKRLYDQLLDDLNRRQVERALDHEIRDRSRELCLALFDTALRWQSIQGDTAMKNEIQLQARVDALIESAAQATDPIAREQYERAATSLGAQLVYMQSIARGRERTIARIVAQLALLEKLRFSLVNFQATDSERLADELRDVATELERLTQDVDITNQALIETAALPAAQVRESIQLQPTDVSADQLANADDETHAQLASNPVNRA